MLVVLYLIYICIIQSKKKINHNQKSLLLFAWLFYFIFVLIKHNYSIQFNFLNITLRIK